MKAAIYARYSSENQRPGEHRGPDQLVPPLCEGTWLCDSRGADLLRPVDFRGAPRPSRPKPSNGAERG